MDGKSGEKSEHLQPGAIQVLPDTDKVMPRSPEQTLATLEEEARRIRDARRNLYNRGRLDNLSTKDW